MFNKGQIAGLMKQAQAMQDNLKKAQAFPFFLLLCHRLPCLKPLISSPCNP